MGSFALLLFFAIFINFLHGGTALRCRVSNQQTDDQFKKILHVCRQRNSGRDVEEDERSSDDSDDSDNSSTSIEDVFDKRLFLNNNNNNNNNNRYASTSPYGDWNNDRNSQSSNNRNDRSRQYNRTYGYSGDMQDRNMGNHRGSANQGNRRKSSNADTYNNNYNNGQDQACTIQCFFSELNVVDHRGFPERRAVTNLMTQNIQDPELKDFVEESIIECFRYLDSSSHKEKCRFSQTLLACLAEKGKERCDDWD